MCKEVNEFGLPIQAQDQVQHLNIPRVIKCLSTNSMVLSSTFHILQSYIAYMQTYVAIIKSIYKKK